MDFEKVLATRLTTRNYKGREVSDESIESLIQAAKLAPLAMGDFPTTHLTVIKDQEILETIRQGVLLKRKNGEKMDPFYGASLLMIVSTTDLSDDHIEYANAACIIENILLEATYLGLGSTYIWGCLRKLRNNQELLELLSLPEGSEILSAVVIGHPAEPLKLREEREEIKVRIL